MDLGKPALKGTPWRPVSSAPEIYFSLFTLLASFPAALNSDVFFIICTFFAADLCLERKGKQARKKEARWMSSVPSSEVVENHIQQLEVERRQQ